MYDEYIEERSHLEGIYGWLIMGFDSVLDIEFRLDKYILCDFFP